MTVPSPLRPIADADHPRVLAWNAEHVELLAPLDEDRLRTLRELSQTAAVIEVDGQAAGFVLTFGPGVAYDSANYRWFSERHQAFVYLDRIVVDPAYRRTGLAGRVYDVLEAEAAARAEVFCLEVNLDPPNEPSLAFHRGRGYEQVGELAAPGDGHRVVLLEKRI